MSATIPKSLHDHIIYGGCTRGKSEAPMRPIRISAKYLAKAPRKTTPNLEREITRQTEVIARRLRKIGAI